MKKCVVLLFFVLAIFSNCKGNKEQEVLKVLKKAEQIIVEWQSHPKGPGPSANEEMYLKIPIDPKYTLHLSGAEQRVNRLIFAEGPVALWDIDVGERQITYGKLKKGYTTYVTDTKVLSPAINKKIKELEELIENL